MTLYYYYVYILVQTSWVSLLNVVFFSNYEYIYTNHKSNEINLLMPMIALGVKNCKCTGEDPMMRYQIEYSQRAILCLFNADQISGLGIVAINYNCRQ